MAGTRWVPMLTIVLAAGCAPPASHAPEDAPPTPDDAMGEGSPWERSRQAGYAFRGVGQEPGWTVEIAPGREIRAVLDYGERTVTAPAPAPSREGARTVYRARAGESALWVAVEETPCADAMSGERMTHTVALRIDGREMQGCGRELGPGAGQEIAGEWRLVEVGGRPALPAPDGRRPHLRFDPAESRAGGHTGCNTWGADYTRDDGRIRFGEIVMTRAACALPALNEQERRLATALERAERVVVEGGMLSLLSGETVLARFEAAP